METWNFVIVRFVEYYLGLLRENFIFQIATRHKEAPAGKSAYKLELKLCLSISDLQSLTRPQSIIGRLRSWAQ